MASDEEGVLSNENSMDVSEETESNAINTNEESKAKENNEIEEAIDEEIVIKNVDKTNSNTSKAIDEVNNDISKGLEEMNEVHSDASKEYASDNDNSNESSNHGRKNVAKRGRKRRYPGSPDVHQRESLRRAARNVKCYIEDEIFQDLSEITGPDDPDYQLSDSDDDPDFDPARKRGGNASSPDSEFPRRRSRTRAKGKGKSSYESPRKELSNSPPPSGSDEQSISSSANSVRKRGRPTVYNSASGQNSEVSDNTVSSTDDSKVAGSLSSAYNYASARSRQNQAIRLPEGPNLTDEQLKLIESQFKSGDFVMAKKDADMMEHPPIWRIDGKSLLQKFQAFDKDGKILYRNISTYSGWTAQAKALYVPVKVNFVFQSRYDTVVELVGFTGESDKEQVSQQIIDKPVWMPKNRDVEITDELRSHMQSFEIYLQTLISQALDNNFLHEIYEENDAYFVDRVKVIDDLTEERKKKILEMVTWKEKFLKSLTTWPCVNTMVAKITGYCQACDKERATMLSQFYGQPYDEKTLRSREPNVDDLENKNFETCDSCSTLSQLFNKVTHQKYDYYSQCKSTVTNMRVSHPSKTTTTVLKDLLANDEWINGLFRSMCTTLLKIDRLYSDKQNPEEGQDSQSMSSSNNTSQSTTIVT